jgi:hypothetical protein
VEAQFDDSQSASTLAFRERIRKQSLCHRTLLWEEDTGKFYENSNFKS